MSEKKGEDRRQTSREDIVRRQTSRQQINKLRKDIDKAQKEKRNIERRLADFPSQNVERDLRLRRRLLLSLILSKEEKLATLVEERDNTDIDITDSVDTDAHILPVANNYPDAASKLRFYYRYKIGKDRFEIGYEDNIFKYDADARKIMVREEYFSSKFIDREHSIRLPPNYKLFEYVVMMHFFRGDINYGELDDECLSFATSKAALPCFGTLQTDGYKDESALFDITFDSEFIGRSRVFQISAFEGCLGVDIKITKKKLSVIHSLQFTETPSYKVKGINYADSIRAIDKFCSVLDSHDDRTHFIQVIGLYDENDCSEKTKIIKVVAQKIGKDQIIHVCPALNIPDQRKEIIKQLLINKFLHIYRNGGDVTADNIISALNDKGRGPAMMVLNKYVSRREFFTQAEFEAMINDVFQLVNNDKNNKEQLRDGVHYVSHLLAIRGDERPEVPYLRVGLKKGSQARNPQLMFDMPCLPVNQVRDLEDTDFLKAVLPKNLRSNARATVKKLLAEKSVISLICDFLKKRLRHLIKKELRTNITNRNLLLWFADKSRAPGLEDISLQRIDGELRRGARKTDNDDLAEKQNEEAQQEAFLVELNRHLLDVTRQNVRKITRNDEDSMTFLIGLFQRISQEKIEKDALLESLKGGGSLKGKLNQKGGWISDPFEGIFMLKLLINSLLVELKYILDIDLEEYSNHPIWRTIGNLAITIDSVNDDNFQLFDINYMDYYWQKTEDDTRFINEILNPFRMIVKEYNVYIENYNSEILLGNLFEDGEIDNGEFRTSLDSSRQLSNSLNSAILTPSPRPQILRPTPTRPGDLTIEDLQTGGRRKKLTRKKRRKKKKSRRKRRK